MQTPDWMQRIADAKGRSEGGQHIVPGKLLLKTTSLQGGVGIQKNYFVSEFEVLKAIATEGAPNAVGTAVSYVEDLADQWGAGVERVKSFLSALTGLPPEQVTLPIIAGLCGPDQPAKGLTIWCLAFSGQTKSGNTITKKKWDHPGKGAEMGDLPDPASTDPDREDIPF